MGTCNGVASSCALAGYAMETRYALPRPSLYIQDVDIFPPYHRCHLGKIIRYDTVSKLGWSVDIRSHGIKVVIDRLLSGDWEEGDQDGQNASKGKTGNHTVPGLTDEEDCVVSSTPSSCNTESKDKCFD